MRWETVEALLESAKKYAAIEEDMAVKSYKDHVYWHHRVVVDLIRTMAQLIEGYEAREKELINGQESCQGLSSGSTNST